MKERITNATVCEKCGCEEYIFTSKSIKSDRKGISKFISGSYDHSSIPRCYECGHDLRRYVEQLNLARS